TAHPASNIARESRIGVPVCTHDRTGFHKGQDVALKPIRKISGVNQTKCRRRESLFPFAAARGLPNQRRRIPLAKSHGISLRPEPVTQERNLSGLARAVDSFHDNQLALVWIRGKKRHMSRIKAYYSEYGALCGDRYWQ